MSVRFAVIHEAAADFEIATELADRVLMERIEWLDNQIVEFQRSWVRNTSEGIPLTWTRIKQLALNVGIVAMGHFDGEPAQPDAQAARRAIRYLRRIFSGLDGVLLIRDQDDQPQRRNGLEQARREHQGTLPIVVGLAIVERECWVLSGFELTNEAESERLDAERRTLGFDPRLRSHQLTACKNDNAPRSPKRVLRKLSHGDPTRERCCWRDTPLATLRERGAENGLTGFLQEIQDKLAGLFGHPS
jgi:hypothetical protein